MSDPNLFTEKERNYIKSLLGDLYKDDYISVEFTIAKREDWADVARRIIINNCKERLLNVAFYAQ